MPEPVLYVGKGRTYSHGHTEFEALDLVLLSHIRDTLTEAQWLLVTTPAEDIDDGGLLAYRARLKRELREVFNPG